MRRSLLRGMVLAFCLLFAAKGRAAPSPEAEREARRAFQAAEADFKAGRFTDALASYQSGYAQAPLPGFLINIAQCYRRLGDLPKAKATYQKFVMVAPDSPHVPEVKTLIAELDKLIADLAEEKGHGGGAGTASSSAPAALSPPVATTAGSAEAGAATHESGAGSLALSPSPSPPAPANLLTPAAPAPAPETRTAPAKTRWWVWGLVGAAVVAGGTAAAFALAPSTTTVHDGSLGALRR